MGYKLRGMQSYRNTCKHVNQQKLKRELTMMPAQCGVSLARSEGLIASMRKATTVTATPSSSWSRATSSGKPQNLHFGVASASGLSSLFLLLPSLSEEPFFSPIAATFFRLSLLDSDRCSVLGGGACPPASFFRHVPFCQGPLSP